MPSLHPDDVPIPEPSHQETLWWRSLERAIGKRFYERCSGVLQSLLIGCDWYFSNQNLVLTLYIHCPDAETGIRILNYLNEIYRVLGHFTSYVQLHLDSPDNQDGVNLELQLDQFSAS